MFVWWTSLLLVGCPWVGSDALDGVRDPDGDGVLACGFEADGDGCDCDDDDPTLGAWVQVFVDTDGDGVGAGEPQSSCGVGEGFATSSGDCDDQDPSVGVGTMQMFYDDRDGDGYGTTEHLACAPSSELATRAGDCDDIDDSVHPDAPEACDGIDNDCDGAADDAISVVEGATICFTDADGDGFGDELAPAAMLVCPGQPCPAGTVVEPGDCDDTDDGLHPDTRWYVDEDDDSYGGAVLVDVGCHLSSDAPGVRTYDDCDDANPDVFPGAPLEVMGDGVDTDCSGGTDLDADADGDPDRFEAPAPGADWPTDSTPTLGGCDGAEVLVAGAADNLALAVATAQAGDTVRIAYDPFGDNIYDPFIMNQPICIVGDDPRITIRSDDPNVPAVEITSSEASDPYVLLEALTLDAEIGVLIAADDSLPVTLSRISQTSGSWLVDGHLHKSGASRTYLHHISVDLGRQVARRGGHLVGREVRMNQMVATAAMFVIGDEKADPASVDLKGLYGADAATGDAVVTVVGDLSLVEVYLERLVGGLVEAEGATTVTIADTHVLDGATVGALISVTGTGSGSAQLTDLRIQNSVASTTPFVVLAELGNATIERSDIRTAGYEAISVHADTALVSSSIVFAGQEIKSANAEGIELSTGTVERSTVWAQTCVRGKEGVVTVANSAFIGCDNVNVNLDDYDNDELTEAEANCALVSFDSGIELFELDLRPHPRSSRYMASWSAGFSDTYLGPGDAGSVGAYSGNSPWVAELHDIDADGMFDSWEALYDVAGLEPFDDLDGDGLDNATEFRGKDLSWFTTSPVEADTDGDGVDDGADHHPLDPAITVEAHDPDADYSCPNY